MLIVVELIQVLGARTIPRMNSKVIGYWFSTALLSVVMLSGGIMGLLQLPDVRAGIERLGYPTLFVSILGAWKILGVIVIVAPGLPRLKEWAYAGFTINLASAFVAHVAAHDSFGETAMPLVIWAFAMTSWALRPASRRLGVIVRSASARAAEEPIGSRRALA